MPPKLRESDAEATSPNSSSPFIETEIKLGLPDARAWLAVREALSAPTTRVIRQTNHFFDRSDGALSHARIAVRVREESQIDEQSPRSEFVLTIKSDGQAGPTDEVAATHVTHRIEFEARLSKDDFDSIDENGLVLDDFISRWRADASPPDAADSMHEGTRPDRLAPGVRDFLDRVDEITRGVALSRESSFENRREVFQLQLEDTEGTLTLEIELDRSEFAGGRTDFEIEVERTSEVGGEMRRTRHALIEWLRRAVSVESIAFGSKLARHQEALAASRAAGKRVDPGE